MQTQIIRFTRPLQLAEDVDITDWDFVPDTGDHVIYKATYYKIARTVHDIGASETILVAVEVPLDQ